MLSLFALLSQCFMLQNIIFKSKFYDMKLRWILTFTSVSFSGLPLRMGSTVDGFNKTVRYHNVIVMTIDLEMEK